MAALYDILETIQSFLDHGGQVIVVIAWVIFVMWTLIIERALYIRTEHRHHLQRTLDLIDQRDDQGSWYYEAIRTGAISRLDQRLQSGLPMIRTLAAICPLLGLMGTVTGMIVIFDVMAIMGSSSPRAVAAGVAQATMTTMAGMVGALSGVFPAVFLSRIANEQIGSLHNDHAFAWSPGMVRPRRLPGPLRVAIAAGLALVITLGLVYGMQRLIETGERALTDPIRLSLPDFVRIQRNEELATKSAKPEKLPAPEDAPEIEMAPQNTNAEAGSITVDFANRGPLDSGIGLNVRAISTFEVQDGDYLPLVKVAPVYPRRAAAQGLEGYVLLRFTVTTAGTVRDIEVVESTHSIFERAAIQAASKFKYKPRVVDGTPVETTGILHYIRFTIEE